MKLFNRNDNEILQHYVPVLKVTATPVGKGEHEILFLGIGEHKITGELLLFCNAPVRKERPRVRSYILKLLQSNPELSLEDLANKSAPDAKLLVTDGVALQARKMMAESGVKWRRMEYDNAK